MHGRIHAVLSAYPVPIVPNPRKQLSLEEVEELLGRIHLAAEERRMPAAFFDGVELQRRLLTAHYSTENASLDGLPTQWTHGDYHDGQIILATDRSIRAVVDWELFRVQPRIGELMRAIAFARLLAEDATNGAYLRGYARNVRLSADECRRGIEIWWQGCLRNTWAYQSFFFERNERAGQFFADGVKDLLLLADPVWRRKFAERMFTLAGEL